MNIHRFYTALKIVFVIFLFDSCANKSDSNNSLKKENFQAGQIWKYKNRKAEDSSTITILKTENYKGFDTIVHIRVNGVKVISPYSPNGFTNYIEHMPYSPKALRNSVTSLVSQNNKIPDFSEGYNIWKEAMDTEGAGVFTIDVAEMIQEMEDVQASLPKNTSNN